MSSIIQKILTDIKIDLTEEFDRNFERKAFFTQRWRPTIKPVSKGSLLERTNKMRNSIKSSISGESIVFSSSIPYTAIHNDGGTIDMPARKQVLHFNKKGRFTRNNRTASYGQKAKVGAYKVTIPQRQFIGDAPEVENIIKQCIDDELPKAIEDMMRQEFNNH